MRYGSAYGSYYGGKRPGGKRGASLLDVVMGIFTVLLAVGLLMAYLARYIPPSSGWIFAFAGLAAPILFIANIIMCLYWVIRWKYIGLLPAAAIILGAGYLSLFFKPSLSKQYQGETKGTLAVMTYNVMGFLYEDPGGNRLSSIDSIANMVARYSPDLLCIQEFQARDSAQKAALDTLFHLKYNSVRYKKTNSRGGGWGIAVYSRYPIVETGLMDFPASNNSAMWVDIVISPDTVRVFNNHLQTTSVNSSDRDFIQSHEYLAPTAETEERVRGIASKLRRNYLVRAQQADTLAPVIHSSPHRVIVCGDFNDTPLSYVYFKIKGKLSDTFAEKGQGINSNTFQGFFNLFRIDYILHSKDIKALHYETLPADFSDHKAVFARLKLPD
ncbi:MAG: endonuclease/exonuclease/phosphatase family protein [Rikenellaceae bacterium]|nr:endonuclease/exonuclease/phosphatase family protein [Rikenellaceae bacterium]